MKKPIILIGLLAVLVLGYALWEKNHAVAPSDASLNRTTLSGTLDCLQVKDPSLPHTAECRLALKTDAGEYYAVDFSMMSMPYPTPVHGARFTAAGVVTPIENLSSDQWQKYNVRGIFSVTDSVKQEAAK